MKTETKERPIIFSGPMVKAILEGRKTQTRRIITKRNSATWSDWDRLEFDESKVPEGAFTTLVDNGYLHVPCRPHPEDPQDASLWTRSRVYPIWDVGDALWVRESVCLLRDNHYHQGGPPNKLITTHDGTPKRNGCEYKASTTATDESERCRKELGYKWTPSIHMPRWASRIKLEITNIRVQRVQDISEADARAEGCIRLPASGRITDIPGGQYGGRVWISAKHWYRDLWGQINGADSWKSNVWVWAISFRRVENEG
jgi:hypothetical protein